MSSSASSCGKASASATLNDLTCINPLLEAALKACDLEIDITAGASQPLRQDAVSVVAEAY